MDTTTYSTEVVTVAADDAWCEICDGPLPVVIGTFGEERYDAAINGGVLACRRCLGDAAAELLPPPT